MKVFRVLFFVVLTLGLAAPAAVWALPGSTFIFHPQEPGSVLVFHKFLRGFVNSGDGTQLPASAFEISLQCPPETGADRTCGIISGTSIIPTIPIHAHWVCPGDVTAVDGARNCPDVDFILHLTINGTVWISPEGNLSGTDIVPPPPCPKGFLILWVESPISADTPISWNGLTGDAVVRHSDVTDVEAYTPVAIQAVTPVFTPTSSGRLDFDGFSYQDLTSGISGTLHFEDANTQTFLTLLTLDVALADNGYNDVVNVPFNFYNAGERLISASTRFVCWTEVELTAINGGLTAAAQGSQKGFFTAHTGNGDTLLGIIETTEVIPSGGPDPFRSYAYSVYYDPSFETSTTFFQNGSDTIRFGAPLPAVVPLAPAPVPAAAPSPVPSLPALKLP